ncbi:hypothetical protein Prum_083390 [Phytohabitans rumicis]|uniref:non-specific serine/threonine protein kinase n=1 Tax=Phytohabitans rumicis TaxID=1076125 RepID=A0A6V8LKV6_9ACTN|nr:hypothetical protein Prum_083390 [Phytohabitans rumicis]
MWRATDLLLGRTVAVKILLPTLSNDASFGARFLAESRMMAAVRHPGVVQVYDRGECDLPEGGRATYLVMEYVDGEPLSARIAREGRLTAAETMSVVAQSARALDAAHAGGIVHRDVKPSNLLIRPDGTVVLLDFGVARSTELTSLTRTSGVLGTAFYMAPEQASQRPVSAATDVYALGAVAYHALAGHPPFMGESPLAIAMMHVEAQPPELPADVPPPVRAVVVRAMAKNPADRYPTAAAMADAAEAAAAGTGVTATAELPAVLVPGGPPATGRRRRVVAVVGAVAAASVLAVGAALLLAANGDAPPADGTTSAPATTGATQPGQPQRTNTPGTRTTAPPSQAPRTSAAATPSEEPSESAEPPSNPTSAAPEPTGSVPAAGSTPSAESSAGSAG